jgi:hypothetical protein
VRHATKRGLLLLAGDDWKTVEPAMLACNGTHGDSAELVGVESIKGGSPLLPDCPTCAVLWDQAITAGEKRPE